VGAGEAEEFGAIRLRIPHTGYRVQGEGGSRCALFCWGWRVTLFFGYLVVYENRAVGWGAGVLGGAYF
jgi:hypothetical protein